MFSFINEITVFAEKSTVYIKPWGMVIGVIWCIDILNWLFGSRLNILGIYPRKLLGLPGILFSPFLHGSFAHLLLNSIPLFILGLAILTQDGWVNFAVISLVIIVLGGLGVWLFARKALHIGASGLISGYFGYILMLAYQQPGLITLLLAALAIYDFGGIFSGIFSKKKQVSWEAHLFGLLSGIFCAYFNIHLK